MSVTASRLVRIMALTTLWTWPSIATAQGKCPDAPIYPDAAKPTIDKVALGSTSVSGTVKKGASGTVQLCMDGAPQGTPQALKADGTFSISVPALKAGQRENFRVYIFANSQEIWESNRKAGGATVGADENLPGFS